MLKVIFGVTVLCLLYAVMGYTLLYANIAG